MTCGAVRQRFTAANDNVVDNGGATPITEVSTSPTPHLPTNMTAVDTVLGGGIVNGAVYLLGGEPGIGKSTLLMQMAGGLLAQGKRIPYSRPRRPRNVHVSVVSVWASSTTTCWCRRRRKSAPS